MTTSGSTDTRKPKWITARVHESSRAKELDARAREKREKGIRFGASRKLDEASSSKASRSFFVEKDQIKIVRRCHHRWKARLHVSLFNRGKSNKALL